MNKVLILLVALTIEAMGVASLSKGLRQIDAIDAVSFGLLLGVLGQAATNVNILLGVLLEAIFFASLIFLLSRHEMSVIWPLTSLGFVISTLVARFYLQEEVSWVRWTGVLLIVAGATMVGWSEQRAVPSGDDTAGTTA